MESIAYGVRKRDTARNPAQSGKKVQTNIHKAVNELQTIVLIEAINCALDAGLRFASFSPIYGSPGATSAHTTGCPCSKPGTQPASLALKFSDMKMWST